MPKAKPIKELPKPIEEMKTQFEQLGVPINPGIFEQVDKKVRDKVRTQLAIDILLRVFWIPAPKTVAVLSKSPMYINRSIQNSYVALKL